MLSGFHHSTLIQMVHSSPEMEFTRYPDITGTGRLSRDKSTPDTGEEALDELVEAAHSRGIRVMADFIINHVHEDHVYFQEEPGWFNEGCLCSTSGCEWTERRLDCLFMSYMPDIDWSNEEVRERMVSDALWWIERFDLDGLRIDAVKHVDDEAITALATAIKQRFEGTGNDIYLKGETAMGWAGHSLEDNFEQYDTINRYISQDGLDGQADFVLYHAVVDNVFSNPTWIINT